MQIVTTLTVDSRPGAQSGFMRMTHGSCSATVKHGDKELGDVRGCIGGGIQVEDKDTGYTWHLSYEDLWNSVQRAKFPYIAGFEYMDGDVVMRSSLLLRALALACEQAKCPLGEEQQHVLGNIMHVLVENLYATLQPPETV